MEKMTLIFFFKSLLSNSSIKKLKEILSKNQKNWILLASKSSSGGKLYYSDVKTPFNEESSSPNNENVKVNKENEGRLSQFYNLDINQLLEDIKQKWYTKPPVQKVPQWKTDRPKLSRDGLNCRTAHTLALLLSAKGTASRLKRVEDLLQLMLEYPEAKQHAVQCGAIRFLLTVKQDVTDESTLQIIRQALAVLGYAEPPNSSGVRILSIDGGGMRGVAVIKMLEKLEELSGKRILELFDYICGVSTGAIIICCLLPPHAMTLKQVSFLYRNLSAQVFAQSPFWGTSKLVWNHAYYDTSIWENLLKSHVGDIQLLESVKYDKCPKIATISTIINQSKVAPFIFRNYANPYNRNSDYFGSYNHTMFEAVRASAAAPTIFEEFRIGDILHQDGGMIVNNPTAVAVHEAKTLWPDEPIGCVVSCGTGKMSPVIKTDSTKTNTGSTSWKTIFDKILESATDTEAVHTMLNDLLPEDVYFRINPHVSRKIMMDEVSETKISLLEADTEMYFRRNKDKFQDIVQKLTTPRSKKQTCLDYLNHQRKLLGFIR